MAFYRRFYAPDNAVVVIAGRFDEAAALALVAQLRRRSRRRRRRRAPTVAPERAPAAEVRAAIARPVPADRVVIGFPAPGLGDADRAAYEIVAEILLGGPSSRLQRELVVDKELASSVHGDVAPTKDPGLYALWIQMTKGHAAEEAEALVAEELADLARGPSPAPSSPRRRRASRRRSGASSRRATAAPSARAVRDRDRRLPAPLRARRRARARHGRRRAARRGSVPRGGARSVVIARRAAPGKP